MHSRVFSTASCHLGSVIKRSFCTSFSVFRNGSKTCFESQHSINDVISLAAELPGRSSFLAKILDQYNEQGTLNETQESWVRFIVWQDEKRKEASVLDDKAGWKDFTVETRRLGRKTFGTELSLVQAASVLRQKKIQNEFCRSLLNSYDENRLSLKQRPWLYKLAQDEMDKNGTQPKNNVYVVTRKGWRDEFECDLSLPEAYEMLKSDPKPKSEFAQSLLDAYEKDGNNMSIKQQSWLFRLALDATSSLPKSLRAPTRGAFIKEDGRTFSVTKGGVNEEFTCDWPLEKAYDVLKKNEGITSEFAQSLLGSYEQHGYAMSEGRRVWLYKLALESLTYTEGNQQFSSNIFEDDECCGSGLRKLEVVSKGSKVKFETKLSDMEAVQLIRKDTGKGNLFREELVEKYVGGSHLSEKQLAWIAFYGHQLEKEADKEAEQFLAPTTVEKRFEVEKVKGVDAKEEHLSDDSIGDTETVNEYEK